MWDERRPGHFTLSYTRFLYSPDVFHNEFVIIYDMGERSSRRRKMRVFIADDSRVIVERLADLLKEVSGLQLVGKASDVPGAIRSIPKANPDVVILDLQMPGGTGLDVLRSIRQRHSGTWILICTNYPYPQYRDECIAAGADYFLDKSAEFERIPEILRGLSKRSASATPVAR
jgi:DNA-binding NarL/FixJ family response regulator